MTNTTYPIEQLETGEKIVVQRAEHATAGCPRHRVGCTPYECHGALMEKEGFDKVRDSDAPGPEACYNEAVAFLTQFADEVDGAYAELAGGLTERLEQVKKEVDATGTYVHSFKELEYGCRLAWRNAGRCIMRKVSMTLTLRDCRHITTAEGMFQEILDHLDLATNGGAIKPVISVFPPKMDGKSAPVRIWNSQLINYAGYKRPDGSVLGDPARVDLTALAVKLGWVPPEDKDKSDFDLLPLIISDEATGHDKPKVFDLPSNHVLEVEFEHPEHGSFADLNLRWYALPSNINLGGDIGGVLYQTCPFNGWYSITEISRDILDKQRYNMANAVSIACGIPRTTLNVWKDDVQLQVHRAIMHSFAKNSVSIVDHHTADKSFGEFFKEEIKERGKCSADWIWLVPPAGGSMTSVFHQEMLHFIQKPQYRVCIDWCTQHGVTQPDPISFDAPVGSGILPFDKKKSIYDNIVVCYGSETGTSLKFANIVAGTLGDHCVGPVPMDSVPPLMSLYSGFGGQANLLLVVASTFGKGCAPNGATQFLTEMSKMGTVQNWDFTLLALGNSAYTNSFINFALEANDALKKAGCTPVTPIQVADELKNQDDAFANWEKKIYGDFSALIYVKSAPSETLFDAKSQDQKGEKKLKFTYAGSTSLTKCFKTVGIEMTALIEKNYKESWASHQGTLLRSIDLFSFKATSSKSHEYLYSGNIHPGDHVAVFPENQHDSVESVLRLCSIGDLSKINEYRHILMKEVDLGRPLRLSSIQALFEDCKHQMAKKVLGLMIDNAEIFSDDLNSTSNTNPTVEIIVNLLPPGIVPIDWVLSHSPAMMPRFFSISSIMGDEVTITQSAFHFSHNNKAGTTSKWLRLSLKPGDKVGLVFSNTDFHLPSDENAPVIMIAAGSGVAPFRSFWMAKKKNKMHLFFGCQRASDVPFTSELDQLKKSGRLTLYTAYSRGEKAQHVQDKLLEEAETLRGLLGKYAGTTIYVCGSPDMEFSIRETLIKIIGTDILNATMALARMKAQGKYVAEVYGKPSNNADSPMGTLMAVCFSKTVHITSSLERVGVAKSRKEVEKNHRRSSLIEQSESGRDRMRLSVRPVMTKANSTWAAQMMSALDEDDSDSD